MLRYARASDVKEFVIGTETGLLYKLREDSPNKKFYPLRKDMVCPNMKKTTLKSVLHVLETLENEVKVDEKIRVLAQKSLDRMLAVR
jgi:quinolinate synthase